MPAVTWASSATEPTPPRRAELRASFDACAALVRRSAKNFYLGLRLAPQPRRASLFTAYAWMRTADDIVDAATDPAERARALTAFHNNTIAAIQDEHVAPEHAWLWPALAETAHRYGIPANQFARTLEAMRTDLNADARSLRTGKPTVLFEDWPDLVRYCDGVAGVPGLMCEASWGVRQDVPANVVQTLATRRGFAFQMTNITRDLRHDASQGRVYAPQSLLDEFNLTAEDLLVQPALPAAVQMASALADRADGAFHGSSTLDSLVDPAGRAALRGLTETYHALLRKIQQDPARLFEGKVRLPAHRKLAIAGRALLGF